MDVLNILDWILIVIISLWFGGIALYFAVQLYIKLAEDDDGNE